MASRWIIISLVLSLCTNLSTSAEVFLSIDCGSSIPHTDANGITWVGDDEYVKSGESRSIKPLNSISPVADTLRVFPTRNKNCYLIDSMKPGRVQVRASFYYGNYDGKNFPPTFALSFDGNIWTTVETSNTESYYYEVTYVMKRDSISICLAQTQADQFPFISALAIRWLESDMYKDVDDDYPLFLWKRVAFGSKTVIRFPDDPYDRIWGVEDYGNGSTSVSSDAIFSHVMLPLDSPPLAMLKNAISATTPNGSIELLMEFPSDEINVCINWYFSEVTRLGAGQNRSFRIFKDDQSFSDPILPPYGDCDEIFVSNTTVSSNIMFSLVPTDVSTLPPLINAMEIFRIADDKLTNGTNKKDVEGLASLVESFSILQSWSGDPCLPAPYTWDWIKCNLDPIPRVTALLLNDYSLLGLLPDFSSMDALQTINLNNNSLGGPIPDFLGTLPNLEILNLANNQFYGTIPPSLSTKKGLILTVSGNHGLCTCNYSNAGELINQEEDEHSRVSVYRYDCVYDNVIIKGEFVCVCKCTSVCVEGEMDQFNVLCRG